MAGKEFESVLSDKEKVALEPLRQSVESVEPTEAIAYVPFNPLLLSSIGKFLKSPEKATLPAIEEPYDPFERITGLVNGLDEMIMGHEERRKIPNGHEVKGLLSPEGKVLNLSRTKHKGQVIIMVKQTPAEKGPYPRVISEKFILKDEGSFSPQEITEEEVYSGIPCLL
jgi:hypothetical protein